MWTETLNLRDKMYDRIRAAMPGGLRVDLATEDDRGAVVLLLPLLTSTTYGMVDKLLSLRSRGRRALEQLAQTQQVLATIGTMHLRLRQRQRIDRTHQYGARCPCEPHRCPVCFGHRHAGQQDASSASGPICEDCGQGPIAVSLLPGHTAGSGCIRCGPYECQFCGGSVHMDSDGEISRGPLCEECEGNGSPL